MSSFLQTKKYSRGTTPPSEIFSQMTHHLLKAVTITDEKSAAKFHYIKSVSGKVVVQSIAFRVVSIYWQGVALFPWYLNAKGPTTIGSTWRRSVLSADAGLLVIVYCWFRFGFVCLFRFSSLCVFFCVSLAYFVLVLFTFVALHLVSSVLCQEIGWEECLRNNLFSVECGIRILTQSINLRHCS